MKPESEHLPPEPQGVNPLLEQAKSEPCPVVAGKVRARVLNELDTASSSPSSRPLLIGASCAACLLLLAIILPRVFLTESGSSPPSSASSSASAPIEWAQVSSPENVSPALRVAMTEPYRMQQETLRQDVDTTLKFLNRALPL